MKRRVLLVAAILLVAFGLRAARLIEERQGPLALQPVADELTYDLWGKAIALGVAPDVVPYQAPLQAYHLAFWHSVFPKDPGLSRDAVRFVGVLLGVATVFLTLVLGRRASGSFMVGLVAAALVALHRPLIYYEGTLLRDGPGTFATVVVAVLLLRLTAALGSRRVGREWSRALVLGLALGVGALVRENLLLLSLLIVAGLALRTVLGGAKRRRGRVAALLLVACGILVPLAPWVVSNARIEGTFSPLPTWNGGCVFYLHNRADNRTVAYNAPVFVTRSNAEGEIEGFTREAMRRTGRKSMAPHEVSSYWLREGIRDVVRAPALYLAKVAERTTLFLASQEFVQARDLRDDARRSVVLRLPAPGFGMLAAFALAGLLTLPAPRTAPRTLGWLAVALAATTIPIAFVTRYRLPAVPVVAVLAAITWREWSLALRRMVHIASPEWSPTLSELAVSLSRRRKATLRVVLGVAALALGLALDTASVPHDPSANHLNRGLALHHLGRFAEAADALSHATKPSASVLEALGEARLRSGQVDLARDAFAASLAKDPRRARAWAGLALAHDQRGDRPKARAAIRQASALDPGNEGYRDLEHRLRQ